MSLFFDIQSTIETPFSVHGLDSVLVGKTLWNALGPAPGSQYVCISIRPIRKTVSTTQSSPLDAVIAWAMLSEEVSASNSPVIASGNTASKIDHLAVPSYWRREHGRIFSRANDATKPSLLIAQTEPVLLTEVVVTALSTDAYQVASGRDSPLEEWLSSDHTILRHGAVYTFNAGQLLLNGNGSVALSKSFRYRLDMTEPVLQGFAQKGTTRFIVTLSEQTDESGGAVNAAVDEETEDDSDGIEIGESFLANSTFSPALGAVETSASGGDTPVTKLGASEFSFQIKPLLQPVNMVDDQFTLYVRTSDLSKISMLNGDWGMAQSLNTTKYRLVRIVANDGLVDVAGTVTGSPILLHNICSDSADASCRTVERISIRSSPFGSRQPAVPVARTVIVARVASPLSINRIYQPLFLNSLKEHFDSPKHLVKKGDIIAVSIDTDDQNHLREAESDEVASDGDVGPKLPAFPLHKNEVVFFCVTNIEHDVIKSDSNPDMYVSSTIGEMGCWVDSSVTRMVQTGIEHCWVPDVGPYLESASPRGLYSTLSRLPFSHLLGPESHYDKLVTLASAASAQRAVDYNLNLSILLKGTRGIGKFTTAFWVAQRLGMHLLEVNCYDIVGENDTKTEGTLHARFDKAKSCSPCIFVLQHIEALAQTTQVLESGKEPAVAKVLQGCIEDMRQGWMITGYPVITIGTTSEPSRVPTSVLSCFKHEISFEAPGEGERREIMMCSLLNVVLAPDVSVPDIATHTAALVASDLVDLVARAKFASVERAIRVNGRRTPYLVEAGIALTAADFDVALGKARASYSESIGAPKIPNVSWDDVGGLAHVKSDILDTIQLPLEHPELFADGLKKRSGILLYGPPGTGKTLLAKAVATSCSLNFFSIKGPELLNMYIGESEANVRRVFQRARDAKPCVVFFDELDSVAPKRGNQGDSGGVMDRIVSQLLAELDGMSAGGSGADVFVIGATNRPDLLDPALLRPGRFDRMLYLGVSETHQAQTNILEALTRKFRLDPDLNLAQLAEQCPFNYTGADFYALCSDAMLNAMSRKAEAIEEKIADLNKRPTSDHPYPLTPQYFLAEIASPEELNVLVSREDFDIALKALVPSVSQSEMDHYAHIQRRFSRVDKPEM